MSLHLQARFTYLYRLFNGEWKIAEHHSSTMPEQKPAGVEDLFDKWNAALQVGERLLALAVPVCGMACRFLHANGRRLV
jgi:hypothetical protein